MNTGGAYVVNKKGAKPKLVEQTQDHPEGNQPRDKSGKPLNAPAPATKGAKS